MPCTIKLCKPEIQQRMYVAYRELKPGRIMLSKLSQNPSGLTPDDSAPVLSTWRYTGDSKNHAGTRYPRYVPQDDGRLAPSAELLLLLPLLSLFIFLSSLDSPFF